jgi:3-methylfumaryl-CoA hydratase
MVQAPSQSRVITDTLDPARARALEATLGQTPSTNTGDPLPPFAHQIYFWDPQPDMALGQDGHATTGGFIPDLGLQRRMWAAGRLVFHTPLLAGIRAEQTSIIENVTRKTGRTGPLGFVRIRHDIRQRQSLVLSEWQELVYRAATAPPADVPIAAQDEEFREEIQFSTTQLFRYSALTFNGHRIHYDAPYATHTENYAGLVVHGPLLAHMLMALATHMLGTLRTFEYRATSPLLQHETAQLCWKAGNAWVRGPDGRQCMIATASA